MPKEQKTKTILVYCLSIPISVLYIILILSTSTSFVWAVVGYITLGISFGLLQSLFEFERPYRVAFLSTIFVPVIAYLFFALISILVLLGLSSGFFSETSTGGITSIPLSGDVITIDPLPYTSKLGVSVGIAVYLIVVAVLTLPFGIVGAAGRFLGCEVVPKVVNKKLAGKTSYSKLEGGILLGNPTPKNTNIEISTTKATIAAAIISALTSILVAFL